MSGFKVTSKIDENMKTRLQIDGAMDEYSDYSTIETKFTDEVVFDFNDVEHINSTGIKHWVQWVSRWAPVFWPQKRVILPLSGNRVLWRQVIAGPWLREDLWGLPDGSKQQHPRNTRRIPWK